MGGEVEAASSMMCNALIGTGLSAPRQPYPQRVSRVGLRIRLEGSLQNEPLMAILPLRPGSPLARAASATWSMP